MKQEAFRKRDAFLVGAFSVAFSVLLGAYASAQQQPQASDPVLLQRALSVIADQRNAALNAQAIAEAQRAIAEEQIAKLKARIAELEKPADSGAGSGK